MTDGAAALLERFGAPDACAAWLLCDRHPADTVAFTVVEPDLSSRDLAFGELGRESARFAAALADLGIGPGDRVGVLMSRSVELVVTLLGIWRRGAVLVPLSTALGRPAIALRLQAASARLVVVDADRRTKLAAGEGVPADPRWRVVVVRGEPGRRELSYEALMALYPDDAGPGPVTVGGDGQLAQVFTAGTTGPPRSVRVPLRALAAFVAALDDPSPGAVHWDTADPGWAAGLYSVLLGPLAAGRRGLLTRGAVTPTPAWGLLERFGVTHLHGGPALYRAMAATGNRPPPGLALRHASSTGEPLPPDLAAWVAEVLGVALRDRYGQAELGVVLVDDGGCAPGTLGRPLPGWRTAVLAEDRDEPVGPGTVGRLAVDRTASPLMWFRGYADDAERTAASVTADGRWYLTGDTAIVDADGCHRFSARAGDVIVTGGHRIAPFEVESVLMLHAGVAEAVVVGVPAARQGAVPEAYVVLRNGVEPAFGLADVLKQMVRAKLPAYAVPRVVHVVDALPRTPGGAVRRAALRERRANW